MEEPKIWKGLCSKEVDAIFEKLHALGFGFTMASFGGGEILAERKGIDQQFYYMSENNWMYTEFNERKNMINKEVEETINNL